MGKGAKEKKVRFVTTTRRSFLTWLWLALGILAVVEAVWVIISFLRPRKPRVEEEGFGSIIEAGQTESFEPGSVTAFPRGNFYLARLEGGGFLAISRTCTHLGCTVPWIQAENSFICPCHASTFDITGNVINAPAPRALDLFEVSIENNIVKVDKRKRIRRTEFRKEQVVYPREI
jgi:cytochrome b6-f complex iron-sulfur subunit